MKNNGELAPPSPVKAWTTPDEYLGAMARRRTERRRREGRKGPRTEPEVPRFLLSTLPFLVLMAALMIITVGIVAAAWPGALPQPRSQAQQDVAQNERGMAPKGWFDEAKKEFHR